MNVMVKTAIQRLRSRILRRWCGAQRGAAGQRGQRSGRGSVPQSFELRALRSPRARSSSRWKRVVDIILKAAVPSRSC